MRNLFGKIAAANALSDVYAMGGQVLTALHIAAFPRGEDLAVLAEILRGGEGAGGCAPRGAGCVSGWRAGRILAFRGRGLCLLLLLFCLWGS